jgi:signal transduction histidine kinase
MWSLALSSIGARNDRRGERFRSGFAASGARIDHDSHPAVETKRPRLRAPRGCCRRRNLVRNSVQVIKGANLGDPAVSRAFESSIATTPPTPRQRNTALAAVAMIFISFAIVAPFGKIQLEPIDSFVPVVEGIVFLTDFVTGVLLLGQFSTSRSRGLLVLASGYLFTALMVIPHALSFPGAFTPSGLLGGGPQTPPWLYTFWHLGFPIAVMSYVYLKDRGRSDDRVQVKTASAIRWSVLIVVGLVCALTWLATSGDRYLPRLVNEGIHFASLSRIVAGIVLAMSVLALASLWIRRESVLDLWLMVVICALITELAANTFIIASRFSVSFYFSRTFSVVVSTVMLIVLLSETSKMYARLAFALRALQRERESYVISVEAVVASLAHEVRQPLGAVVMDAETALIFLQKTPPDHAEVQESLNLILRNTNRVSEVFASIRALFGAVRWASQPIDVNELAGGALELLRRELDGHNITTRAQFAPELPLVMGHRGQLQEVLLNLIQNAIEAMSDTADRSRVLSIKTAQQGREAVAVVVEDAGPGIDAQKMATIFDPFVSTKAKGLGLGLAICKMIVERHGGRLSASAGADVGARFEIVLPVASADDAELGAAADLTNREKAAT